MNNLSPRPNAAFAVLLATCWWVFSAASLAAEPNGAPRYQAATSEEVAAAFWNWHAATQPSGALTREELAPVRSIVTTELACLLELAEQFKLHFSKLAPGEKPPFAEGDLFTSSAFERPTAFTIESVQINAATASAVTRFDSEDKVNWHDRLQLRLQDGEWRVANVERSGPFEFGNRGSLVQELYSAMSQDIPGGSWSGRRARNCKE